MTDLNPSPTPWPAPPPPPAPANIFLGRFGLRAGWSIMVFIPLIIVCYVVLAVTALAAAGKLKQTIAEMQRPAHRATSSQHAVPPELKPRDATIAEGLSFASVSLATLALAFIERRRMPVYGISRSRLADFLPGAFWGVATLSLLVAILHAAHLLVFDSRALHGAPAVLYGLKWLLVFLFVGLFEEYLNRGFLQFTLTRGVFGLAEKISPTHARAIAFSIAALIMSLLFGAGHLLNARENPMGIVMTFLAGVVFSYALWRTGSLWWAIGFHMSWDWAQSFLYGVPDSGQISAGRLYFTHPAGKPLLSGGIDGPEGSLYVIPIMLLVCLIIRFTTRPGAQPSLEPNAPTPHTSTQSTPLA